jgi:predicted phosphodiesterase
MRALILSDIHGNLHAMDAVLAAAAGQYDQLWHLGDAVGYGAFPNQIIDRMRELGAIHVRGNHDRVASGMATAEGFNPIAAVAAHWTTLQLTPKNLQWLREMPQGPIYPPDSKVGCVHGSPLDEDEYIVSIHDATDPLRFQKSLITFFGHTHLQGGFSTNGKSWVEIIPTYPNEEEAVSWRLSLNMEGNSRYLINPGSVGQPRDFDWRAAFALFDDRDGDPTAEVTFHRIPYAVSLAQKAILDAGLPQRLAWRLTEGR